VLIFAPVVETSNTLDSAAVDSAKQTADCMTVLTALRARAVSQGCFTCCEMHEGSNARFFRLTHKNGFNSSWRNLQMLTKRTYLASTLSRLKDQEKGVSKPSRDSMMTPHSREPGKDSSGGGAATPASAQASCDSPLERTSSRTSSTFSTLLRQSQEAADAKSEKKPEKARRWKRGAESAGDTADDEESVVRGRHESQMRLGMSKHTKSSDLHLSRAFAGGHVFTEGLLDKLLCVSYYNPRVPQIIETLLQMSTHGGGGQLPQLHLRPVPSHLKGGTFARLFAALLRDHGVQAIGLYRTRKDQTGQQVKYVFTKPSTDTVVQADDFVFGLGHLEPDEQVDLGATTLRLSRAVSPPRPLGGSSSKWAALGAGATS